VIQKWLERGVPVEEMASTIWRGMACLEQTLVVKDTLNEQVERLLAELNKRIQSLNSGHDNQALLEQELVEQKRLAILADIRCRDLREQIISLHKSNSWRLTRPLRGLSRWLSGFRGR
jgi:hypothetical protein